MNSSQGSQSFISDKYEAVSATHNDLKHTTKKIAHDLKAVSDVTSKQREVTNTMIDNIIDLKCRSMRDNLMFFGIDESVSPEMRVPGVDENCDEKVTEFCEKVLLIEDPATKIQIDRAHRVGRFV